MTAKEREITREELYKLVWSKPMTELAKEFGMSDVGLAKVCKKLNVPKPYRGYWQLVEADRQTVTPLPPLGKGDPTIAIISPETYRPRFAPQEPAVLDRINAETLPGNRIDVSPALRNAHSAIRDARDLLEGGYADSYGRMCVGRSEDGKRSCLDMRVSKMTLPRALRIMDALLKALATRGYKVKVEKGKTACWIDEERVHFYLWETVKRSEREPTQKEKAEPWRFDKWVFTPTGELTFVIDEPWAERKNWRDRRQKQLEHQLNDIVAGMFAAAERIRLKEIERNEEQERWAEAERRRAEGERQQSIEGERRNQLDAVAASWKKSRELREFLREIEKSISSSTQTPETKPRDDWLAWARDYADELDPFKNGVLRNVLPPSDSQAAAE